MVSGFGLLWDMVYAAILGAFVSIGFFLALKYCRVFLMSYGPIVVLGSYIGTFMSPGVWGWIESIALAAVAGAVYGLVNFGLLRRTFQNDNAAQSVLLTWGFAMVTEELFRTYFGPAGRFAPPLDDVAKLIGGIDLPATRQLTLLAAAVMAVPFLLILLLPARRRLQLAAVAFSHRVAGETGVHLPKMLALILALACAIGAVGGALFAQESAVTPYSGEQYTIQAALAALVAGPRLGSGLAVAAGLSAARIWLGYEFDLITAWLTILGVVVVLTVFNHQEVVSYGE